MCDMEEELRAKALASMSIIAKPKGDGLHANPSSDVKEEGEISSSERNDEDIGEEEEEEEEEEEAVHEENKPQDQEMLDETAAIRNVGTGTRLDSEPTNADPRNKLSHVSHNGKGPPHGLAHLNKNPTTIVQNTKKNPLPFKRNSHYPLGWFSHKGANDNLVIRFSDNDSDNDTEEKRETTGIRSNRKKSSTVVSYQNRNILQRPRNLMGKLPKKVSSSHTFISSTNRIHGASFRGISTAPITKETLIQKQVPLTRSCTSQVHELMPDVNSTYTELESLRQKIARCENELKLQRKSIPPTKENFSSSDGDFHDMKHGAMVNKSSRSSAGDAAGFLPKEPEKSKRLKQDENSHGHLHLYVQRKMPAKIKEPTTECREQAPEKTCCVEDSHSKVHCKCSEAVPMICTRPSLEKMPGKGNELNFDSSRNMVAEEKLGESSFLDTISSSLPGPPGSTCTRSILGCKNNLIAAENSKSSLQSLINFEEFYDRELEKAQDIRRNCELEERRALKAYRSAQRSLFDANEKCNALYRDRELLSAKLRTCMLKDSGSLWSQRCDSHETELDPLKNVNNANVDLLLGSSYMIGSYELNAQCSNGAPLITSYENMNVHDLGADICSEPDASTSELDHQKDKIATNGVPSPSNNHEVPAVGEDETVLIKSHCCDKRKEGLEERKNNVRNTEQSCFMEDAQDAALLEASLRSKLVARLRKRNSCTNNAAFISDEDDENIPFQSHLCDNRKGLQEKTKSINKDTLQNCFMEDPQDAVLFKDSIGPEIVPQSRKRKLFTNNVESFVDKATDSDVENTATQKSADTLPFSSDAQFLDAEQVQISDLAGHGRHGRNSFLVSPFVHDQNQVDKFISDDGDFRSTENEEISSFLKEYLKPVCTSISHVPTSAPKIVFRHLRLLPSYGSKLFQADKDRNHLDNGVMPDAFVDTNCEEILLNNVKAHSLSNVEGQTGRLNSCDLDIDPFWPHCMFELRGKCNNDECTWQHTRDYSIKGSKKLSTSNSEIHASPSLSTEKLTEAWDIQRGSRPHTMPVPSYLIGTNPLKADTYPTACMFARSIHQYWQWNFCVSFAVPFSIQRILPSDISSFLVIDACIKDHNYRNGISFYFHKPDNTMQQSKSGSSDVEKSLELALDHLYGDANKPDGKKKALAVLSQALKTNPTSVLLWVVYLHTHYGKENSIGDDDMFHLAVQGNDDSYELWLKYINSRMQHCDRLEAYYAALSRLSRIGYASNNGGMHSACILDLFLQMVDFLCMSNELENVIKRIYGLLSNEVDSDNQNHIFLLDIFKCLSLSDKCVFWACCVYLVIYKKLPQEVLQRLEFEQQLSFEFEWPSLLLNVDEKQQALELMKIGVKMVTQEIEDDSCGSGRLNGTDMKSIHFLVINHVKCVAAFHDTEAENLLVEYMKLYPTCTELVLTFARWLKENAGAEISFERFNEALCRWPEEDPNVHCIWNQYAQFALENERVDLAKELMSRWFESVWKVKESIKRKLNGGENTHVGKAELYGLLNYSLFSFLEDDKNEARLSIDKALKLAANDDLKHIVLEHAIFTIYAGTDHTEGNPLLEIPNILLGYLTDVRLYPISEPLSRRFCSGISKRRNQELVNRLLGPVSLDCSLLNAILRELYGPTLLPEHFGKVADFVDFVEALMEIHPANYHLAMSACKVMLWTSNRNEIRSAARFFWAGTHLVNSIFQAFPVAPEWVWIEAIEVLHELGLWDVSEKFHQMSILVHPFSVKLWRSYCNLAKRSGDGTAIVDAASERGIKLT